MDEDDQPKAKRVSTLQKQSAMKKFHKNHNHGGRAATKHEKLRRKFNELNEKTESCELKIKNTNRALNIAKTLYGMVDEMDSTDFGAQRDSTSGILGKSEADDATSSKTKKAEDKKDAGAENQVSNIEDLVLVLEKAMTKFKYSSLSSSHGLGQGG